MPGLPVEQRFWRGYAGPHTLHAGTPSLPTLQRGDSCRCGGFLRDRGYPISVVAAARPKEGLALLRKLVESGDPDARWIARENLKKRRLRRLLEASLMRVRPSPR